MKLQVSDNGRFLQTEDGQPFFLLGDTDWELFHRLTREEADLLLETRAQQGFNTIFAVALAEFDGLRVPNLYEKSEMTDGSDRPAALGVANAQGEVPLHNCDPTTPNDKYFEFVDYVVDKAESLGMFVALLPTWGDKWNLGQGGIFSGGMQIFTPENAAIYGEWIGKRYAGKSVIWILGGDRPIENPTQRAIIEAMAEGLNRGGAQQLKGFHPCGGQSSSQYFHEADWLDFNMIQSGHCGEAPNADMIARDYELQPAKPCMDGEPRYENHPIMQPDWSWRGDGRFDARDVRRAAYHAVFAGAFGHVYGCHDIWQMFDPARKTQNETINNADTAWHEAIGFDGANQMQHLKKLIESRPYFSRVPAQDLLVSAPGEGKQRVQATRDENGSYALVYSPDGQTISVHTGKMAGEKLVASWFDPRLGTTLQFDEFAREDQRDFTPPSNDDWVLVLENS